MKEFLNIFVTVWEDTKYNWKHDRKEFWEVYLGMALIVFLFWFLFWIVLPIVEPYQP